MWNGCFFGEDFVYFLFFWIVLEIGIFEGIEMEKVCLLNELFLDFKFRFELFVLFIFEFWVEGNKNRNGILNIVFEIKWYLLYRKKNLFKIRKKIFLFDIRVWLFLFLLKLCIFNIFYWLLNFVGVFFFF